MGRQGLFHTDNYMLFVQDEDGLPIANMELLNYAAPVSNINGLWGWVPCNTTRIRYGVYI